MFMKSLHDEPEPESQLKPVYRHHLPFHPSKRPEPEYPFPTLELPKRDEAPLPGRYISKRKRALSSTVPQANEPNPNHRDPHVITQSGSISESDLPCDILSSMRRKPKGHTQLSQIPEKLNVALHGHAKAVNAVHWSPTHAVKDIKWSQQGLFVLSCGYDCSSRLIDVEKGLESQLFRDDQIVDVRTGKVVHEYIRGLGPILDVEFSTDGKQFVPSSDVSGGNISENSIIIWDISRQVPLSNQVYAEAYTCPCVSLDGEKLASGSSDGSIYFYNSRSSVLIKKIKAYEEACVDVAFHPILSNVTASCSWNGDVSVFE
ncbi:hypothetical protein V6N12_062068 [Hibiscus sabdariffa]|uniref:Transducin/WD40 repeat-like superfamily protein n=1 Tax=Hibiscus sabdariffa TaxID=183260 RepID=A0ABR1ZJI5_9ROSI